MIGKKKWYIKLLIIIALCLGAIYAAFPILWMVLSSFKPNAEIFAWPPTWISEDFSLKAYTVILKNRTCSGFLKIAVYALRLKSSEIHVGGL